MDSLLLQPIAYITSCFDEKFAIPRQPLLASAAKGYLEFVDDDFDYSLALNGLKSSSHIWLIFAFHAHGACRQATVRPPRLGGNKKVGVFATRSSFRPNGLGLSVVKLDDIELTDKYSRIYISGLDLLNGTPVYDIKPYVPYADALRTARNDLATTPPKLIPVTFSQQARTFCLHFEHELCDDLGLLLTQLLSQNPAPAYHKPTLNEAREYGFKLLGCEVKWSLIASKNEQLSAGVDRIIYSNDKE